MHLRSLKRVRGEVSLYDPIGVDREGNEITLVDFSKKPTGGTADTSNGKRVKGQDNPAFDPLFHGLALCNATDRHAVLTSGFPLSPPV